MNLQYISDNKGKTTGVFIPIQDWNNLKKKYKEIDQEEEDNFEIPEWHKKMVLQALKAYEENPEDAMDWDLVQKEIEKKYDF